MSSRHHRPSRFQPFVLLAPVCLALSGSAAAQDSTPPAIGSLAYAPTSIDTTSSSATVTLTVRLTDDLAGVNWACVNFRSPSGQTRGTCFDASVRTSGTAQDGWYQNVASFPQYGEAGTWHIPDSGAYVVDLLGNSRYYTEAELIAMGFPTTLEVTSVADVTAPELKAMSFSPTSIDVSNGAQNVTVTVRFTDAVSGLNWGCVNFSSPSGQTRGTCFDASVRTSGTAQDGWYQNVVTIPRYSEGGTWHIRDSNAYVVDQIGNSKYYTEAELAALGFPTTLEVVSDPADITPPAYASLQYVPKAVNTTLSGQDVTITVRMTDALSGLNWGCVNFTSPSGQTRGTCFDSSVRVSGDASDGVYRNTFTFPQFSELGTWRLADSNVYAVDVIGNSRYYTQAELVALGFPTTLLVTTNLPPVANAGPDGSAEVGASVTLTGSGVDPDGAGVTFQWLDDTGTVIGTTASISVVTTLGPRTYTLRVTDTVGLIGLDTAVVTGVDTTPPTVTVVAPNGGERLYAASPFRVRWTVTDVSPLSFFDVLFSTDGGANYTPVAECTGVPGTARECIWLAPGVTTATGRIRVVATDASANVGLDNSNLNFTVLAGAATVKVTAPNKLFDVGIGSPLLIKWTHTMGTGTYVRVEVSRDGRETWQEVAAAVKNSSASAGSYNWTVSGPLTPTARIRVTGMDVLVGDMSDVDFTISPPYVTVAEPSTTTADFGYGTTRTAAWVTNITDKVEVGFSLDGGVTCSLIVGGSVNSANKKYTFATPALGSPSSSARLCVHWLGQPVIGMNPVDFRVGPPYVKVTMPNIASDVWTIGTTQTITWATNLGTAERVNIELSKDDGATYPIVIASATPADGTHAVVVQAGWATSTAKVRISWVLNGTVKGVSAQGFKIQ